MSDTKKNKAPIYTTPAGIAAWPRLDTPNTKWNADGEYEVVLILDEKAAESFLNKLENLREKAVEFIKKEHPKVKVKEADSPVKAALDSDKNEIEGKVSIRFKMKAKIKSKASGKEWTQRPSIFDAKLQPLLAAKIGGGSTIKVGFEAAPYLNNKDKTAGITLRLKAVQVLNLIEWNGSRDGKDFGFAEEEGYSAEATPDRSGEEETGTAEAGDGSEEF